MDVKNTHFSHKDGDFRLWQASVGRWKTDISVFGRQSVKGRIYEYERISLFQDIQTLTYKYAWLEQVCLTEKVTDAISITWAVYHATQKRGKPFEVSISSLLPLIRDQAHSVATIKHAVEKIRDTVAFLDPGQTPVLAADQPLYALAKQIQWQWPDYGEDKFVIMFGGLHIELALLRSIGTLLQDSGWTSAICEANGASSGTAESFLTASSITRTRQAHLITACRLHNLMKKAFQDYCTDEPGSPQLGLEDWCVQRRRASPHVPVLESGVRYGAGHTYTDPFFQRRTLWNVPLRTLWYDPLFLRK